MPLKRKAATFSHPPEEKSRGFRPRHRDGPEDLSATSTGSLALDLAHLHAAVVESEPLERQRALHKAYERGSVHLTVWPALVALYQSSSRGKEGESASGPADEKGRSLPMLFHQGSRLLALIVSWSCRDGLGSGSAATALDFVQPHELDVWQKVTEIWWTNHPVSTTGLDHLEQLTAATHLVTITWALATSQAQTNPDYALVLWKALQPHVTGLSLWHWMPERRRELYLRQYPILHQAWKAIEKPLARPFIITVIQEILRLVRSIKLKSDNRSLLNTSDDPDPLQDDEEDDLEEEKSPEVEAQDFEAHIQEWVFLHRALEMLTDLLSSPLHETRRFLIPYLHSIHFSVHCRLVLGTAHDTEDERKNDSEFFSLTRHLIKRLDHLINFPVNDQQGKPLSNVEMRALYHRRAGMLQKMCQRYYADRSPDVIYAGMGVLCETSGTFLQQALSGLTEKELLELLHKMRLVDQTSEGANEYNRDFLLAILQEFFVLPGDPLEELQSFPLYPTESLLWDFSAIPPSVTSLLPPSHVLALPKLSTHYLTFADYLRRSFELVRLESSYEIRSDLVDVIRRVRPVLRQTQDLDGEEISTKTEFSGWARMALELQGHLQLIRVDKPKLGEKHPSQVLAEFRMDLSPCGETIRREWDSLGEFDNLFLVAVDATQMTGQSAPLMRDYHMSHGSHRRWITDGDRRVPDEEDRSFPQRYGVRMVRGCMILQVRDEEGTVLSEPGSGAPKGTVRIFRVAMDVAQFSEDIKSKAESHTSIYQGFNLVVRRHGRENNFRSVLETIRGLMEGMGSIQKVLPVWLHPIFLGQGDAKDVSFHSEALKNYALSTAGVTKPDAFLDFGDTFLNETHLRSCFEPMRVVVDGRTETKPDGERRNYRLRVIEASGEVTIEASSYPFAEDRKGNSVLFTPIQVQAIRSGLSPGLTLVVGPPGTGKTDVAVQIVASLFHSFPTQRTIVVTHSNAALNDIFEKVMARGDVNERFLVRLGSGERDLHVESSHDFTKAGRVAYSFSRRGKLLEEIQLLSESMGLSGRAERGVDGSPSFTCETAAYFKENYVMKKVRNFERLVKEKGLRSGTENVMDLFPFCKYFQLTGDSLPLRVANEYIAQLKDYFAELEEYRPLELLKSNRQRTDYLLMKQARIVAMTCTHAAIARSHLIELGFEYDNIVIEEAGQMLDIETFVPLLLQKGEGDGNASQASRLKRVCLMGDHNQLPPVVKNNTMAHYSNLDKSLFSRLILLGVPHIQLDKQGRARAEIAKLYSWRYKDLGNLDHVLTSEEFKSANAGLANVFQFVNIDQFQGKGETAPIAHFYQNVGEAEFVVAMFQYMVLIGYPPHRISILTTYNGQKELLGDILSQRCGVGTPLAGIRPRAVSTVDQYQGQQNDYVLLSLVRTESVGHLRDVRRLVVALSRARLGLYVFGKRDLFAHVHELKSCMGPLCVPPAKLQLVLQETYPSSRRLGDPILGEKLYEVDDVSHLGSIVYQMQEDIVNVQKMDNAEGNEDNYAEGNEVNLDEENEVNLDETS